MDHALKDIVDCIAYELKSLYCKHRSKMQRVDFNLKDDKWEKYFRSAAEVCIAGSYNPAEFMEVQFFTNKPWPSVAVACSANAEARFMENRKSYAATVVVNVNVQTQMFEDLAKIKDVREILECQDYEFDGLFIHVAATLHDLQDIMTRSRDAALLEYITCAHYDSVYGTALPEWLKLAAGSIRSSLSEVGNDSRNE